MQGMLSGKRILIAQSTEFMGPMLCEVFELQFRVGPTQRADL